MLTRKNVQNLILNHFPTVPKIKRYACIQGKPSSLATAKLAVFATDIPWESCLKFDLEQLSNGRLYNLLLFFLLLNKLCP